MGAHDCATDINFGDALPADQGAHGGARRRQSSIGDRTYWIAKAGDKPVAGILDMRRIVPDADPPHWLSYLEVDDVDRMVAAAQSHGGRIVRQPFDVPDFGRIAIGADATGAFMAWATPKR